MQPPKLLPEKLGPRLLPPKLELISAVLSSLVLAAFLVGTAAAQSGRRLPKSAPTPEPAAKPSTEAKPEEKKKPTLRFVLGMEERGYMTGIPSQVSDTVLVACADRLDDAPAVEVNLAARDVNRGEAVKRAKAEKEAYVIWMHLRSDNSMGGVETDPRELYLEYYVFAPTTAKVVTSGRTYQRLFGTGPVVMEPRVPGRNNWPYIEQALKLAAREAAERILAAVSAELPSNRMPG